MHPSVRPSELAGETSVFRATARMSPSRTPSFDRYISEAFAILIVPASRNASARTPCSQDFRWMERPARRTLSTSGSGAGRSPTPASD